MRVLSKSFFRFKETYLPDTPYHVEMALEGPVRVRIKIVTPKSFVVNGRPYFPETCKAGFYISYAYHWERNYKMAAQTKAHLLHYNPALKKMRLAQYQELKGITTDLIV